MSTEKNPTSPLLSFIADLLSLIADSSFIADLLSSSSSNSPWNKSHRHLSKHSPESPLHWLDCPSRSISAADISLWLSSFAIKCLIQLPFVKDICNCCDVEEMIKPRAKQTIRECPKMLSNLIDLVNLPPTLREFVGQSQISRLGCFMRVWSYIKTNNLQDPTDKNMVNCDKKLKSILSGNSRVHLSELPDLVKVHFPKEPK